MGRPKKFRPEKLAVLEEISKRIAAPAFDIKQHCFKEQLALIEDEASFSTACTSRRAGKTIGCAADLVDTALKRPGTVSLYITLSRSSAKRIIWPVLLELNRVYNLGAIPNIADLSLTFPNASVIYCSGAKTKSEIEKFRGLPLVICYIDEAQSFGSFIEELIDDVISKALYDYNGRLRVIGTPPPIPAGYFFDICKGEHSKNWSHHHWDMRQNPWLYKKSGKTPLELIDRDLKRMGVTIDHPTIQRECFGLWTTDLESLVFKYNAVLNSYDSLPTPPSGDWNYVVGVDMGFDDADAIAVLAYHENIANVYLVEEIIRTKQTVSELANVLADVIKRFSPHSVVLDAGGLGKKINEELNRRFSLPIKAAEKSRKFEYIELLNDSLRTGKFFAKDGSQFSQDCMKVEWDKERSKNDRLVVSSRFHSDITDAVLYAFRESLHFLSEPISATINPGSAEWYQKQVEEMEQLAEDMHADSKLDKLDVGAVHITKTGWKGE